MGSWLRQEELLCWYSGMLSVGLCRVPLSAAAALGQPVRLDHPKSLARVSIHVKGSPQTAWGSWCVIGIVKQGFFCGPKVTGDLLSGALFNIACDVQEERTQ